MEDFEMKIEYLPTDKLKPYKKNTRKHGEFDVSQIQKSIELFGFSDPIGVWGEQNIVVEGHGRLLAAQNLGMKSVPCIRLDHMTDEQRREYAIMHNKTAELSEWDFEKLDAEISELDLSDFSVDFGIPIEIPDEDINKFFEDASEKKEKEPKRIQCPVCGEWFDA